jgi:hypothetical protein
MPTPIRTIEAFLSQRKAPEFMDAYTARLEKELRELKEHSRLRDQRIVDAVIERNIAYNREKYWEYIATAFFNACRIDGFGDVADVHNGDASKAVRMYKEAKGDQ